MSEMGTAQERLSCGYVCVTLPLLPSAFGGAEGEGGAAEGLK